MLFKKKKEINNTNSNVTNNINNIEFVDLENNSTTEVTNTLEKRINFKVIIIRMICTNAI